MKTKQSDLNARLIDVGAALRGAEPLDRPAPSAPPPLQEAVLRSVADNVAQEVIDRLAKYRDTTANFGVRGLIFQAIKGRPEEEQREVWRGGLSEGFEDRLAALLHSALIQRGYSAGDINFDKRNNYDGMLEMTVSGVQSGVEQSTEAHARLVGGPNPIEPRSKGVVYTLSLHTMAKLLTDAAIEVPTLDRYVNRFGAPEVIRKATVALEKAARQLEQLRGVEIGPGQAEPYRQVQRSYAQLLFALSNVEYAYQSGHDADQELLRRKEHPRSGLRQIGAALLESTAPTPGNFERRIQDALNSLYAAAPLNDTRPAKISATDYVATQFSWASREILADPAKAEVLLKQARQLELADLAIETKDYKRALGILRGISSELSSSLGSTLVTGQMIARLGDLEVLAGRDDKASRAYVGALRVMTLHLPKDHALVRAVATKLKESGERWLGSLDTDHTKPMSYEARTARSDAEAIAKQLELDAILSSKGPAITTDPGAGPTAFAEALPRARPGELHTPPDDLYWQLHYAIHGPIRG